MARSRLTPPVGCSTSAPPPPPGGGGRPSVLRRPPCGSGRAHLPPPPLVSGNSHSGLFRRCAMLPGLKRRDKKWDHLPRRRARGATPRNSAEVERAQWEAFGMFFWRGWSGRSWGRCTRRGRRASTTQTDLALHGCVSHPSCLRLNPFHSLCLRPDHNLCRSPGTAPAPSQRCGQWQGVGCA